MTALSRSSCSLFAASVLCVATNAQAQASGNATGTDRRLLPLQTVWVLAARPKECSASKSQAVSPAGGNVGWGKVKALDIEQRCTRLAQGLTRVSEQPKEVMTWLHPMASPNVRPVEADNAHKDLWLAERTLLGRAWLGSGETVRAYAEFRAVQAQSPVANWHPFAVHDFAVSASRLGHFDIAVTCYRRLASLAAWLPTDTKTSVLIEGAAALLHLTPAQAPEALTMLEELERENLGSDAAWVVAALQLVAKAVVEPDQPLVELPPRGDSTAITAVRLSDEDVAFFDVLARYTEWGRSSREPDNERELSEEKTAGEGGGQVTSPAHLAILARMRATP